MQQTRYSMLLCWYRLEDLYYCNGFNGRRADGCKRCLHHIQTEATTKDIHKVRLLSPSKILMLVV